MSVTAKSAELEADIVRAHDTDDRHRLCTLYLKAGELLEADGDIDAACFLFTHAYVFGLDSGNQDDCRAARAKLVMHGRDR